MTSQPQIILDKSFLSAHSAAVIHDLCKKNCVLAPSLLFYELFTCSPGVRQRCFAKFPAIPNPVELIEIVGKLLRFEARKHRPARPLYNHRAPIHFTFNSGLASGAFQFTAKQQEGIAAWRRDIADDADRHVELCQNSEPLFPGIRSPRGRLNRAQLATIRSQVSANPKLVRAFYNKMRKRSWPRKHEINGSWALYRWTQVHLIAVLRHWERNGLDAAPPNRQVLEHDVIDMQLQVLGILAGRIATRDKYISQVVGELAPSVVVVN